MKVIQQGAEAIIYQKGNEVIKDRIPKSYRIKVLDEKIRKIRTKKEIKLLEKAGKVIPIPKIINNKEKFSIEMQFIKGKKLSETLDSLSDKEAELVCKKIGENISKLHNINIIHGDLTTSNMIWVEKEKNLSGLTPKSKEGLTSRMQILDGPENQLILGVKGNFGSLYFIDFGLGYDNGKTEDKAVDLHLLKQALEAKHFSRYKNYIKWILDSYKRKSVQNNASEVIKRLEKVESRGRYKERY